MYGRIVCHRVATGSSELDRHKCQIWARPGFLPDATWPHAAHGDCLAACLSHHLLAGLCQTPPSGLVQYLLAKDAHLRHRLRDSPHLGEVNMYSCTRNLQLYAPPRYPAHPRLDHKTHRLSCMGLLYRARPTSRADNTRAGRAGHTKAARGSEAPR